MWTKSVHLPNQIPTGGYKVIEEEQGNIPMTCFRFDISNTENILQIGTAGGGQNQVLDILFNELIIKQKLWLNFKTQPTTKKIWTKKQILVL